MEILLQVILILVNAFFAGTEMAVVSLNATKLRKMQEEGNKIAGKLLSMVEDSSAFLSTIQVAITLAGYLGAAFAGENFAPVLSNWLYNDLGFQLIPLTALNSVAIIIITIILSYFTLVFGELVPKRIALQKSYEWAKMACGVIRGMAFVLRPVIWLLSVSVNGVLRLLHMKVEAEEENVTEDEIRMMVDLGGEKGAIDEDEQEWIQNVFDFGDSSVRESMTPRSDMDALQVILILVNAFFAGTEMAVVSLNATKLRKMQEEGNKIAGKLLSMVEDSSAFLSTIQVAITLAGYLGAAFAGENFAPVLSNWLYNDLGFQLIPLTALNSVAIIIITIILSYFTLVFGELVPKRIALQKSYEWAKMACGVIRGMAFVLRPVIWLLSVSVNGVLRLLHMKVEAEEENVTEDEIRMMVDLGGEKGAIDEDEQEWIQNVFDFGDSSVRESMTPRSDMDALDIESTDGEILEMIQETGRSRFPVYEESVDTILGILNVRDYLLDRNAGKKTSLKDLLRPAYFVPETMKADNLFKEMQKEKVHIAVVVDEYGGTEGIITMEDLLEEIVGNIYDEFDKAEQPEVVPLGENQWRIAGSTPISTLVDDLELPLPESDDYDTLGGLIVTRLNAIPKDGEQLDLQVENVALHVEKIEDHRIESVVVRLLPKEEPEKPEKKEKEK